MATPIKSDSAKTRLPQAPVERWLAPVVHFLHIESSSGVMLLACTALALALANSPWSEPFAAVWHTPCQVSVGAWSLRKDLLHVINDGLMAIFFFVVGLEIKREIVAGELREVRKAALPIVAALGGMVVPALVFLGLARVLSVTPDAQRGWSIPMATDIAFVVGILTLLGSRIPFGLKILLLSLAIVDDLGAVLVIAAVFTEQLHGSYLAVAGTATAGTWILNRIGVRSVPVYVVVGAIAWWAVLKSGVHPTIAGVLLGLMTPSRAWVSWPTLSHLLRELTNRPPTESEIQSDLYRALQPARFALREAVSPLNRLETSLHPWVAFIIMPVFALANAGVAIRASAIADPLAMAVAAGLLLGKPLGIFAACWLAVKMRIATLPDGVSWRILAGGACLAGIGFTMSLFLVGLALPPEIQDAGKLGTLTGSLSSAILGIGLLMTVPGSGSRSVGAL